MENEDLKRNPFDHVHLQWFSDSQPVPEPAPEPTPAPELPPEPAPEPPSMPEPELKAEGWTAQLPDKYKKSQKHLKDLLQHKTLGEMVDRLYASEAKVPKVPEKPEDYEFAESEFPEHLQGDEHKEYRDAITAYFGEVGKAIREAAHKNGLSQEAAQEINALFVKQVFDQEKAARDAYEKAKKDGIEALKADWKANFSPNVEMCRRVLATFDEGGTLVADIETEGGLENKPSLVKFLFKVSEAMGEGVLVPGTGGSPEPSPEDARKAELKERYPELAELDEEKERTAAVSVEPSEELKKRYGVT